MQKKKSLIGKIISGVMACAIAVSAFAANSALAAAPSTIEEGTYSVDSDLSMFVNAMGGIEFGSGILNDTQITVDSEGNASMTLNMTKSQVTIYSVVAYTFVDNRNSALGYYDNSGALVKDGVTYTTSSDTAPDSKSENVNYVDSMTFPLDTYRDTYNLYIYLNSNVMGVQFCDGSGTGASNNPDVTTPYKAILTVDWDTLTKKAVADETKTQSANVVYNVDGSYEISIPSTITVDSSTKTGSYKVEAKNFVLDDKGYVTVTAQESGKLSNGSSSLAFTNALADGKFTKTGDALDGTVTVTDNASSAGEYKGTIDFTISYFSGN